MYIGTQVEYEDFPCIGIRIIVVRRPWKRLIFMILFCSKVKSIIVLLKNRQKGVSFRAWLYWYNQQGIRLQFSEWHCVSNWMLTQLCSGFGCEILSYVNEIMLFIHCYLTGTGELNGYPSVSEVILEAMGK